MGQFPDADSSAVGIDAPLLRGHARLTPLGSDEPVNRERNETGAIPVRMAPSHLRFRSFEVFLRSPSTWPGSP